MRQRIKWLSLLLCIWSAAAYPSSVIQHAEKLLASQQPEKAYQWLNQHQEQLNGSAKELYVYGLVPISHGCHIILGSETVEQLENIVCKNLGEVNLRGRKNSVSIYTPTIPITNMG